MLLNAAEEQNTCSPACVSLVQAVMCYCLCAAESIWGGQVAVGRQGVCSRAKDPGQQWANPEVGDLLDGGPGTVQECEWAVSGDSGPVRDAGQEV